MRSVSQWTFRLMMADKKARKLFELWNAPMYNGILVRQVDSLDRP
jgi:hypothetical protein